MRSQLNLFSWNSSNRELRECLETLEDSRFAGVAHLLGITRLQLVQEGLASLIHFESLDELFGVCGLARMIIEHHDESFRSRDQLNLSLKGLSRMLT